MAPISKRTWATLRSLSFFRRTAAGENIAPQVVEAYRKVVAVLPRFQVEAGRDLNYKVCYPRAKLRSPVHCLGPELFQVLFSAAGRHSLQRAGAGRRFRPPDQISAERAARLFSLSRLSVAQHHAARREPFFLDYQGGRKGALQYDIASLLYDAKADLPPELRQQLLDHYLERLRGFVELDREAFMQHYYAYVYVRIMQALGAYGFRGFYERKAAFSAKRAVRAEESALAAAQRRSCPSRCPR